MPNLSFQYYKGYYRGFNAIPKLNNESKEGNQTINGWKLNSEEKKKNAKHIEAFFNKKNKHFIDFKLENIVHPFQEKLEIIRLQTTYPGLLIGTGYTHGIGAVGEFKLGFHFDYTSGLPIIPAHSVKGAIRSVFPDFKEYKKDNKLELNDIKDKKVDSKTKLHNEVKAKWLLSLLENINSPDFLIKTYIPKESITDIDLETIYRLELEIFDGVNDYKAIDIDKKFYSIYKRDVFHDAYPITSDHPDNRVLDTDSITPHIKAIPSYEMSKLTNPNPLLMLKVLPKVTYQFHFTLFDNGSVLNKNEKILLFQKILLCIGLGAKTNVGYGKLVK